MKKVKIMLLSLILLAVVGAALAFKAKRETPFCRVPALFWDSPFGEDLYYCEWDEGGLPVDAPGAGSPVGTIGCAEFFEGANLPFGIATMCVRTPFWGVDDDSKCMTLACNAHANLVNN